MEGTGEETESSPHFSSVSDETLSFEQYIGLCIACISGCILSIIGSVVILYCSRYKLSNLYHRTLAILSVFDILNSFVWALHPFVFDVKGTEGLYWANGSFDTCAAGGFFSIAFALSMWLYSFYLGVYFVLIIRYQWSDRKISRYFEVPAFLVAIGISWSGAILGVVTKSFNPRPNDLLCLSQGYPFQCELSDEVECIRGGVDANAGNLIASVSMFSGLGGFVTTSMVYMSVYQVTKKHRSQHSFSHLGGMEKRLQEVAKQCFLYFLVYLNVMIWPLGTNMIYGISKSDGDDMVAPKRNDLFPYLYSLISWFFFPITGLFNCMVFLRPRYVQWQRCYPQKGRIWVIQKAIGSDPLPEEDTGVVVNQTRRSTGHRSELRGVSKALELYETRDFDSKLDEPSSYSFDRGMEKKEITTGDEKKEDIVKIEDKDDADDDVNDQDEIVFENKRDDDSDFSGDDIEMEALQGAPNDRPSSERDRSLKVIVQ